MKNKAGSVMKNLPGLVQRKFIDLKNVMEDYSEPVFESGDGILNNLEGRMKLWFGFLFLCAHLISWAY